MSYKNLEIWALAKELVIEIHDMTLTKLPKFEMFEIGNQVSLLNLILLKDMAEDIINKNLFII